MECPLFDLWRRYKFSLGRGVADGVYGKLPALDFEMNEDKFKEYVDSLNDFTKEEIKQLKKYNVHNIDKL